MLFHFDLYAIIYAIESSSLKGVFYINYRPSKRLLPAKHRKSTEFAAIFCLEFVPFCENFRNQIAKKIS